MASTLHAAAGAVVALLFWTALGLAISRRIFPRALALPLAPALGWCVHNAAALPIFLALGFSALGVAALAAVAVSIVVLGALAAVKPLRGEETRQGCVSIWAYLAAAALALAPAAAIVPEHVGEGVVVAKPIYDHAKVAIIDAITRLGLPPANPFLGELGERGRLAYYYLGHFSAAQLAIVLGLTGWEADIALTWFSAFSSLTLMMGIARSFAHSSAALWVLAFAATGSLRYPLWAVIGGERLDGVLAYPTGFAGWLFQSAWVPQHLASASSVILAMLLICRMVSQPGVLPLLTLVLVVVAGFESSVWIGGVAFALSALVACVVLMWQSEPVERRHFALALAGAATLSIALSAPLLIDELATVGMRGASSPVIVDHFAVLGTWFKDPLRRVLDLPAYWVVLLPVEFPATYVAGLISIAMLLASRGLESERRHAVTALAALAAVSLVIPWLLVSTLAENNDLGLRAVLPGAMILIIFSAAGVSLWLRQRRWLAAGAALGGLVLGLPDAAQIVYGNAISRPAQPAAAFAQTPQMWEAVRRHSEPAERVGNNPLFLAGLTPWPVNLSWALLSNRSSCFAGRELVLAYVSLTPARRVEIDDLFTRVFNGTGSESDVRELALHFGCRVVVVSVQDGAWARDPFAANALYQLVETAPDRWRIYRSVATEPARSR
jgi:hypothetical protein